MWKNNEMEKKMNKIEEKWKKNDRNIRDKQRWNRKLPN